MIYIFFYKHYFLIMNNKFTSRKAKNVATANYNAFTKKKIAGNSATSNIFTSIKNAKDIATKNS